jgi:two-component system, NarL family, nitrate/nitrite response regulator NarL
MEKISIAFVDDHPTLLSGLTLLFRQESRFDVVAQGSCAADLVQIAQTHTPDVIVTDLKMDGKVLESITQVARRKSPTRVIVFNASNAIDDAIAVLQAGASGFILKGSTIDELISAIDTVWRGGTYITPSFAMKVVNELRDGADRAQAQSGVRFSARENQVLEHLLTGSTNKEIAEALDISDKTVKHHVTVLMHKLNVRNRTEVVIAVQQLNKRQAHLGM